MGLIFLIVVGAVLGWLAAIVTRSENLGGILRNVSAGIAGACLAGLVINPLVGAGSLLEGGYSVSALLISLLGSILLLVLVNLWRGSASNMACPQHRTNQADYRKRSDVSAQGEGQ